MSNMLSSSVFRARSAGLSLVVALVLGAGCSSDASTSAGSTTIAGADESTTTAPTDLITAPTDPTATVASATTVPAPSTTVAPEPLILREDGLGPFDFGSTPTAVVDAISAQLGAPARNDLLLYEDASHVSEGYYESLDPPYYYALAFPVGRTTCWTGEFCAEFGGASEAALAFIGWQYSGPAHMLASSSNLTISAEWEDFPSMIVYPTCYTTGGGTHHGIVMVLEVAGGWDWLVPDGTGTYVENLPDPASTRVTFLSAGQMPFQAGLDC